jgi:hypothetical protein
MEIILELLVEFFGEVCCQLLGAGLVDAFTGVAGYQSYKKRAEARKHGEPPPTGGWSRAFWILLPIAVLWTAIVVVSVIWRRMR